MSVKVPSALEALPLAISFVTWERLRVYRQVFPSGMSVRVTESRIERLTLVVIDSVFEVGSTDRPSSDHFEVVL